MATKNTFTLEMFNVKNKEIFCQHLYISVAVTLSLRYALAKSDNDLLLGL